MKIRKLVCGVGINDADYVIQRNETVGLMQMIWSENWG